MKKIIEILKEICISVFSTLVTITVILLLFTISIMTPQIISTSLLDLLLKLLIALIIIGIIYFLVNYIKNIIK